MRKINTLDLIIHPTYNLDIDIDGTKGLIDRITTYVREHGSDPQRLFVLEPVKIDGFTFPDSKSPFGGHFNEVMHEHYLQTGKLIGSLRSSCPYFYIQEGGRTFGEYGRSKGFGIDQFLEENGLQLNSHKIELIGHGSLSGACVQERLEEAKEGIKAKHPRIRITLRENEETTW